MEKTHHTAHFKLSFFLQSRISAQYLLDSIDISVLTAVSYLIDSGKNNTCFALQSKISKIAGVDRKTVNRRLQKLSDLGLVVVQKYINDRRKRTVMLVDNLWITCG